jgi:hypothetical protein
MLLRTGWLQPELVSRMVQAYNLIQQQGLLTLIPGIDPLASISTADDRKAYLALAVALQMYALKRQPALDIAFEISRAIAFLLENIAAPILPWYLYIESALRYCSRGMSLW